MALSLQVSGLGKAFNKPLLEGVNLTVEGAAKIALIGDNGSGKSTFLKILAGRESADQGGVMWGRDLKIGYLEQELQDEDLSGGEKKILRIAELFYGDFDVLLLDEPDNHLDLDHKLWFENLVKEFDGIVIVISHDRKFLENGINRIWLLEERGVRDYGFGYSKFRDIYEGERESRQYLWETQEKERVRLADAVERFRAKAAANSKLAGRYRGMVKRYEKWVREMTAKPPIAKSINLNLDLGRVRKRKTAVQIRGLYKSFDRNKILIDLDLHVFCGEKIAFSAPNGSGKSTLMNILVGKLKQDEGVVRIGDGLTVGYYAQEHMQALDESATLIEELQKSKAFAWFDAMAYLKKFLFTHEQIQMAVKWLSGGQKSRLQLAKFLATSPDILVLDEPTNHLDLKTVVALERFLQTYEGALILVSHDRELVKNVVDKIYELKNGRLKEIHELAEE